MLYNYWGYSTVNFFSPMNRYGQSEQGSASMNLKLLLKSYMRMESRSF